VITITGISDHLRLEWPITITGMRRLLKVDWQFTLAMAAHDLTRLPRLLAYEYPSADGCLAVGGVRIRCWLGTGASDSARSISYPTVELLGRVERRRRFSMEQEVAVLVEPATTCRSQIPYSGIRRCILRRSSSLISLSFADMRSRRVFR
jgi:hypothetical protein